MSTRNLSVIGFGLALVCAFCTTSALADENDPPTRAARLAYAEGPVSFQPGGTQDWVTATVNRPLTTGDQLWADANGRAELQLDGSALRLAGTTSVSLLNLSDDVTQIQLSSGTLIVRVRRLDDNETYEIDTPNLAFSILRPGLYRVSVDANGSSTAIRIRSGQGEVTGGGTAYSLGANDDEVFSGTDELVENAQNYAPNADAFDAWSANRDGRWEHSVSSQYVSPDVVGYEDLDDQGDWRPTPEYGNVWFPSHVEADWAPYHTGHWSYIAPWGYTWVDDQSWGFAPFHYGRWISVRGVWGWIPCPPRPQYGDYVRPVYAPALVAWVGVGAGVAWFALGPREVYIPSYPVSRRYVDDINRSNTIVNRTVINNVYNTTIINNKTVNITNVNYVNRNVRGAVAVTTQQAFNSAQPVSRNIVRVDQRVISSAPNRAFAPAGVPTREAVLGSARVVSARPPEQVQTRAIVARATPPAPQPSFDRRVEAIRSNAGRPLSTNQIRQIQPAEPARVAPIRVAPAATPMRANAVGATATTVSGATAQPPRNESRPIQPSPVTNTGANRPPTVAVHPNDLPQTQRPPSPAVANSMLEREHLQQQQQLQAQQEQERHRVQLQQDVAHQQLAAQQAAEARRQQAAQQQQQQAQQQARQQAEETRRQQASQQQADQARQQQIEQQHQQQTEQLAQQHAQQQQELQRKQQAERRVQESQTKPVPPKQERPPNTR